MKKLVCIILVMVLSISVLSVNVSASNLYTCNYCHTPNAAYRYCKHDYMYNSDLNDYVTCPYRNQYFLGDLHSGVCDITREYSSTGYRCTVCMRDYVMGVHMCHVIHDGVQYNPGGKGYDVCSTFLNLSNMDLQIMMTKRKISDVRTYSKEYIDLLVSGEVYDLLVAGSF